MNTQSAKAWSDFVARVESELSGNGGGDLGLDEGTFGREQDVTRALALGLRNLFRDFYETGDSALHHHVVYRQGDTVEDRAAWKAAQDDKWINVHGVNFVPDILIRPVVAPPSPMVLPIEVKLLTKNACSQDIAAAIGQAIHYSLRYPRSIAFIGVSMELEPTDLLSPGGHGDSEAKLRDRLTDHGISLIFRRLRTIAA